MATIIPNTFTSYQLSDEEVSQGTMLTIVQKQVLSNRQANIAEEKLRLEIDPEHPLAFIQQEAYLKGQLELLDYILEDSATMEEEQLNQHQHNIIEE